MNVKPNHAKKYLKESLMQFQTTQKNFAHLLELNEKTVSRWIKKNYIPRYVTFIIELANQLQRHENVSFNKMLEKYVKQNEK